MKMSPMHFEALRVAILARYTAADRVAMWSRYVARGLSATRFRWDMFWASGYQIQKLYDAGLNDLHIDTALRDILPIRDLEKV